MTRTTTLLLLCALPLGAVAAEPQAPAPSAPAKATAPAKAAAPAKVTHAAAGVPQTEDDKVVYAIGAILSGSVKNFALTPHEAKLVEAGFSEGVSGGKPSIDVDSYRPKIQSLLTTRAAQVAAKAKEAGKAYRDEAAKARDTTTSASGIIMTTVRAGSGAMPTATDQVKVHYEGKLIDGTIFDSSIQRGQPVTFPVNGVVPCWTEALQKMNVGEKVKLICPPELAYGDRGSPPKIPGGSTLVFDVELLDVVKAAPPAASTEPAPAATAPQAAAPADSGKK